MIPGNTKDEDRENLQVAGENRSATGFLDVAGASTRHDVLVGTTSTRCRGSALETTPVQGKSLWFDGFQHEKKSEARWHGDQTTAYSVKTDEHQRYRANDQNYGLHDFRVDHRAQLHRNRVQYGDT